MSSSKILANKMRSESVDSVAERSYMSLADRRREKSSH